MFGKKKHLFTFFVVFVVSWTMFAENAAASGGDEFVGGTIAAKGPVLDENGKRIWVEYDERGRYSGFIHAPDGSRFDENSVVMPAEEYRARVAEFYAVLDEDDVEILTRAEYSEREFSNAEGQPAEKPVLAEKTKSVVARTVFVDDFLLLESPIDLNNIAQPGDGAKTLLLNENGRVVCESALVIGFLSAFYSEDPSDIESFCETSMKDYQKGQKLWAPVWGAEITATNSAQKARTDENGDFRISYVVPTCPGTSFPQTNQLLVKLRYGVFDPQRMDYSGVYYLKHEMRDECSGIGEGFFGFTMGGLMMRDSAASIERSMSEQKRGKANIAVDVAILTGRGILLNEKRPGILLDPIYLGGRDRRDKRQAVSRDGYVQVGETTIYGYEPPQFRRVAPLNPDLDGGGVPDGRLGPDNIHDDPNVRVWLNSQPTGHAAQDLTRLGDFNPDFSDQGLLVQISPQDLEKTDTYLFRSNGRMIFSSRDLGQDQIGEEGTVSYRFKIRGPADNAVESVNRIVRINSADPLSLGETLRVVVVNRATGYMGTATADFEQFGAGGMITVMVENIPMRPPNLTITARRKYKIKKGLTAGEKPEHVIGFEGSGLTDDEFVSVETDWRDWDGSPLPDSLDGFTGRLAHVAEKNVLRDSSQNGLAQFPINPGLNTVVLKLPEKGRDLHYYLHVSGTNRNPDFSTEPPPQPPYVKFPYRPRRYVPVRVPIYDEAATANLKNTLFAAVGRARQNLERLLCDPNAAPGDLLNASLALDDATSRYHDNVKPVYKYPYRPETQFSLYDLDVTTIWRTREVEQTPHVENIYDDDRPVISPSDEIDIRYTLAQNPLEPLAALGPERELVFSVGAEEVRATVGGDGSVRFDKLGHLALLEMEDYMVARLCQNGDDPNMLWQFKFAMGIYIETKDDEFPNVRLRWDDYHPQLGAKTITIRYDGPEADWEMEGRMIEARIVQPANGDTGRNLLLDSNGNHVNNYRKNLQNGKTEFVLSALGLAPRTGGVADSNAVDDITIRFRLVSRNNSNDFDSETVGTWHVKNNSNTTFSEVKEGLGVFVMDTNTQANHVGQSNLLDLDINRKVDFFQELLNQVVARKRATSRNFSFIYEDGIFGPAVRDLLQNFKDSFGMAGIKANPANPGDRYGIGNTVVDFANDGCQIQYGDNDDTTNIFRKLMKDYGHRNTMTDSETYLHNIVDKGILVGREFSASDFIINNEQVDGTGRTSQDTGLYELYLNVICNFVEAMMDKADEYESDVTAFKDRNGQDRTGVSYCFGGNDTVAEYQSVATNQAYAPSPYPSTAAYNNYRGNLSGGKQYSGLLKAEQNNWTTYFNTCNCSLATDHKFYPQHWGGIDCSGFVQRVINAADPAINPGNGVPDVVVNNNHSIRIRADNLNNYAIVCNPSGPRYLANRSYVAYHFENRRAQVWTLPSAITNNTERTKRLKILKKGDLLQYAGHITIMYSSRYGISQFINNGYPNMEYDIIHASGNNTYHTNFARKVMITGNDYKDPIALGRIKLWE